MSLSVTLETPFGTEIDRVEMPEGLTLAEMAKILFQEDAKWVTIWVASKSRVAQFFEIAQDKWHLIRPKAGSDFRFMVSPGEGGNKGKNILAVVAAIAVTVIAPQLATAILPAALAGTGAALFTAAGLYGVSLLFPPSVPTTNPVDQSDQAKDTYENVSVGSNILEPGAPLPCVKGLRRIKPPLLAQPHFFLNDGGFPCVNALYGLAGHHHMEDFEIDDVDVSALNGITIETVSGAVGSGTTTFITKVPHNQQYGKDFTTFSHDNARTLLDQIIPVNSEPQFVRVSSRGGTDIEEFYIRLSFSSFYNTSGSVVGKPMRIRIRRKGTSTWKNVSEIHWYGEKGDAFFKEIRFGWEGVEPGLTNEGEIRTQLWDTVPALGATLTLTNGDTSASGPQWEASEGLRAENIARRKRGLLITLDETLFPKGAYEVEIKMGASYYRASLNTTSYAYGGTVGSFFYGQQVSEGAYLVAENQSTFPGAIKVEFLTTLYTKNPWTLEGAALIAVQAVNQSIGAFSLIAGHYVNDYDNVGETWDVYQVTQNPAAHLRDIHISSLNGAAVSENLLDNTAFVEFWEECDAQGYEVNAILSGQSLAQAKQIVASAGFGKPRVADQYGVFWHKDRENDIPVQNFSAANVSNVTWSRVFDQVPGGITVTFYDETQNYIKEQVNVANPLSHAVGDYLAVEYDSITNPTLARLRGLFELLQVSLSNITWSFDAGLAHIKARRGDLIGLSPEMVSNLFTGSYVSEMLSETQFSVAQRFDYADTGQVLSLEEFLAQENVLNTGIEFGVALHTSNGLESRKIVNGVSNIIEIESAFTYTDLEELNGQHLVIGPYGEETRKMIVTEIRPKARERASLVATEYKQKIEELLRS